MKIWTIEFSDKTETDQKSFIIDFYDVSEYNEKKIIIASEIIEEILVLIENHNNYNIMHNITKLDDPNGKNFMDKDFIVILGTNILEQKFGILFIKCLENCYCLEALWPEEFLLQFLENNELLMDYLSDIVNHPTSFYDISIITK
ncbi:MAG: hypothetical protein ACTSRP_00105 [Candidatus Helarchaeota archaeon]